MCAAAPPREGRLGQEPILQKSTLNTALSPAGGLGCLPPVHLKDKCHTTAKIPLRVIYVIIQTAPYRTWMSGLSFVKSLAFMQKQKKQKNPPQTCREEDQLLTVLHMLQCDRGRCSHAAELWRAEIQWRTNRTENRLPDEMDKATLIYSELLGSLEGVRNLCMEAQAGSLE